MISSVIAKLNPNHKDIAQVIREIDDYPGLETGQLIDSRLLPVTIESADKREMEQSTQWIQTLDAVEFVDVVFVHFESE